MIIAGILVMFVTDVDEVKSNDQTFKI